MKVLRAWFIAYCWRLSCNYLNVADGASFVRLPVTSVNDGMNDGGDKENKVLYQSSHSNENVNGMMVKSSIMEELRDNTEYKSSVFDSIKRAGDIVKVIGQAGWPLFVSSVIEKKEWTFSQCEKSVSALESLGPTFVKFGQALSSRRDYIPLPMAQALEILCDDMSPCFDTDTAKDILTKELNHEKKELDSILSTLSPEPIAAASVGLVYTAYLSNGQKVAVKIQRPNIDEVVYQDTMLLQRVSQLLDTLPFIQTDLGKAVDEFMTRIWEELDYQKEVENAQLFAQLYSAPNGTMIHRLQLPKSTTPPGVIVPHVYEHLCTPHIIIMEWIQGTKLTSDNDGSVDDGLNAQENLKLVEQALFVTLCQLLDTGIMHADPHGGNLLKVNSTQLAYLDFGLLATIPESVRDALVCAVAQLVFHQDVEAVASLFAELDLLPPHVIDDEQERLALTDSLSQILDNVLDYNNDTPSKLHGTTTTVIPKLKFDQLLDGLTKLIPRFQFKLPPYFVNNARALGTLEGIAKSLDPEFNALQLMYPYSLQRLISNPSQSPIVERTLQGLLYDDDGVVNVEKIRTLIRDSSLLTGYTKRQIISDILKTKGGKKLILKLGKDSLQQRLFHQKNGSNKSKKVQKRQQRHRYDYFKL